MTVASQTAEWNCTKCGTTNRKLVAPQQQTVLDRCVSCRAKHRVERDARPVRWRAEPASR